MSDSSRPFLPALTPLRGFAAIMVVFFHSHMILDPILPHKQAGIVASGWLWVDFFFILSGFIMTYVYGETFRAGIRWQSWYQFFVARFSRVWPLNAATLLLAAGLAYLIRQTASSLDPFFYELLDPAGLPASLLFLQGMHVFEIIPLNPPSWSLSTEWWMYMIFPFLVPLILRQKSLGRMLWLVVVIIGYVGLIYVISPRAGLEKGQYTLEITADFGFLRCGAGFLLGMWVHEQFQRKFLSLFRHDLVFGAVLVAILVSMQFRAHDLLIVGLFVLLMFAAVYNQNRFRRVLAGKACQLLGDWSFSIYMVHMLVIFGIWVIDLSADPSLFSDLVAFTSRSPDYARGWIRLGILLIVTLGLSALSYRYVEVPARVWLRNRMVRRSNA